MPWILLLLSLLSISCSHTINYRSNHFFAPITAPAQWKGHVAAIATTDTRITILDDYTQDPPLRTDVKINKDYAVSDLFLLNSFSLDADLAVLEGVDVFIHGSYLGARWQFLNHKVATHTWVAALQAASRDATQSTEKSNSATPAQTYTAKSKVQSVQGGLSVGYKFDSVVTYISYLHEDHKVSTRVTSPTNFYGPYDDKGLHQNLSIGLQSFGSSFLYALEYSMIQIKWNTTQEGYQNNFGFKLGYAW